MSTSEIDPKIARALIRSLTRGTAIREGVRHIHVGHEHWLAAQDELLGEIAEDSHSDTKFVRGTYGAGKSHFLSVVQDHARESGWATCHVECKLDGVQIDRFETLYPKVATKLVLPTLVPHVTVPDEPASDPTRVLLDRWSESVLAKAGIVPGAIRRPFDADERVYGELHRGLLRSNLPPDFTRALIVYVRAALANDLDSQVSISLWLGGAAERVAVPEKLVLRPGPGTGARRGSIDLRPIGKGTAREVMRGLLWLVRAVGAKGLVLCIDEIEELAKLRDHRRQDHALQALREFVDDAGAEDGYRYFCLYLAATPEMFESDKYFPRYDALATRIESVTEEVNWRAPVVDLDRTPLVPAEMHAMARRIFHVHRIAHGAAPMFDERILERFVESVLQSRLRIAKPRLMARLLVDELERARQDGGRYRAPEDPSVRVAETAKRIAIDSGG